MDQDTHTSTPGKEEKTKGTPQEYLKDTSIRVVEERLQSFEKRPDKDTFKSLFEEIKVLSEELGSFFNIERSDLHTTEFGGNNAQDIYTAFDTAIGVLKGALNEKEFPTPNQKSAAIAFLELYKSFDGVKSQDLLESSQTSLPPVPEDFDMNEELDTSYGPGQNFGKSIQVYADEASFPSVDAETGHPGQVMSLPRGSWLRIVGTLETQTAEGCKAMVLCELTEDPQAPRKSKAERNDSPPRQLFLIDSESIESWAAETERNSGQNQEISQAVLGLLKNERDYRVDRLQQELEETPDKKFRLLTGSWFSDGEHQVVSGAELTVKEIRRKNNEVLVHCVYHCGKDGGPLSDDKQSKANKSKRSKLATPTPNGAEVWTTFERFEEAVGRA